MLVALIEAYCWTRDEKYLSAFEKQFDWIWTHQIDHKNGDWFGMVTWDKGNIKMSEKGNQWKCAYHNGRALMRVEQALTQLLQETSLNDS